MMPVGPLKEEAMQYLLMIYGDERAMLNATPDTGSRILAAYGAYTEAMKQAKVYIGGNRLKPTTTASAVRVRDGKTKVQDGPFAETKEQLGGYYLIEAPNLDEALQWAAKCPGAQHGTIEVRAIWQM
jgi:hypothetical protein